MLACCKFVLISKLSTCSHCLCASSYQPEPSMINTDVGESDVRCHAQQQITAVKTMQN